MMRRSLDTFPLQPSVKSKLSEAGFDTVLDLDGVGAVELAKDTSLTDKEALQVLNIVKQKPSSLNGAQKMATPVS